MDSNCRAGTGDRRPGRRRAYTSCDTRPVAPPSRTSATASPASSCSACRSTDPVKITRLTLTNRGASPRRLTLTSYVEWALGAQREHTRHQLHTWRDEATGAVFAENFFADDFTSRVAFSWVSEPVSSFTANREEFIGRNGDLVAPAALQQNALRIDGRGLRSVRRAAIGCDARAGRDARNRHASREPPRARTRRARSSRATGRRAAPPRRSTRR